MSTDYFKQEGGLRYAGLHLLIDLWGASFLDDPDYIKKVFVEIVEACQATLLHVHVRPFTGDGVSGVAVLSESHVSVHTWPEAAYAAVDVFMCGACDPHLALPVLRKAFAPEQMNTQVEQRGIVKRGVAGL